MQPHRANQRTIGDYAYGARLGSGTYGEVYVGTNIHRPNEQVAIKEIMLAGRNTKELRYLNQELKLMESFDHPNVLGLLSSIEIKNIKICLILQLCHGGDLQHFLRSKEDPHKNRALHEDLARDFICQIAAGLKYLHDRDIIHRDLKPANILMTDQLELKISDFGFARQKSANDLYNSYVGTPLYMAPEVWSSNVRHYTSKCDIWSAGVIFYEMLTGLHPIKRTQHMTDQAQLKAQVQDTLLTIPYPRHISALCVDLLKNLLNKKPHERFGWDQFFSHPYLAPQALSQSTMVLQQFGQGDMIIQPEVERKLRENTARLHTITLLSRQHHSEQIQIGLRDEQSLFQIKHYVSSQAGIDPSQLILTDQNGKPLDDSSTLSHYHKEHFYLFAVDIFEQQAINQQVICYKNMPQDLAQPLSFISHQVTPVNQMAEKFEFLRGLYEVIKLRTESTACAVRDFDRHVTAAKVALSYLTVDVKRFHSRFQSYKDLFQSQKEEILKLIANKPSVLAKLQEPLDPAFQTATRKKLVDLVPKQDLELYDRLETVFRGLDQQINAQVIETQAPLTISEEFVSPTQVALDKAKKLLLAYVVQTKGSIKRFEALLQTIQHTAKPDDLQKLNAIWHEVNEHDKWTSAQLIEAYRLKTTKSLELIAMLANYVAELRKSSSKTAELVLRIGNFTETLQKSFMAAQNIAELPASYHDTIDFINQRKAYQRDVQNCVSNYKNLFNVLSEKITATAGPLPPGDSWKTLIPELFTEPPKPQISMPIFPNLPKISDEGVEGGFEIVDNQRQTFENKLAEQGSLITSISSMLESDLGQSSITPYQQIQMLESQIESLEKRLESQDNEKTAATEGRRTLQRLMQEGADLRQKLEKARDSLGAEMAGIPFPMERINELQAQIEAGKQAIPVLLPPPELKALLELIGAENIEQGKRLLKIWGNNVEQAANAYFTQ